VANAGLTFDARLTRCRDLFDFTDRAWRLGAYCTYSAAQSASEKTV
jgi:hypothetical protein